MNYPVRKKPQIDSGTSWIEHLNWFQCLDWDFILCHQTESEGLKMLIINPNEF